MNIFGLYIGRGNAIIRTMREACLDTVRCCERLAVARGLEAKGEYGRGRNDAARDIRKLGDDIARDLNKLD